MQSTDNKNGQFTLRALLLILIFALLISPVFAILQNGEIKIFAVTDDHKGMAADLLMYTISGNGAAAFITSNSLVGKDTQTTGNIALQIAQKKTGVKLTANDLVFDIRANASEVDGPSAGAAMTLLTYSMLSEKPLASDVAMTGTINTDGSIGMVGGVGAKAQAASIAGIKLFMIPAGEAVSDIENNGKFDTVNLLDYAPKNLGMKVVEVSNIDQAITYAYSNIADIAVDSNSTVQTFIPQPITFDPSLIPMKSISQKYIDDAKAVIAQAKKSIDQSTLDQKDLADLYQRYSSTNNDIEMAQRFLDQNYLYSAANYAFNARVLAGTVKEIADNPSLLTTDTTLLSSKISSTRKDLELTKQMSAFVPTDEFEWIIGDEQRLSYAENSLNKIDTTDTAIVDNSTATTDAEKQAAQQQMEFQKVYDYVSAQAWISVAKDFLVQAQLSTKKKIPVYSKEFTAMVDDKISSTEKLISDSNVSQDALDEANRRLTSAKISMDNNFLFAALYDAYFADAFISGELQRKDLTSDELLTNVTDDINAGSKSDSVWANLYFDHAKFYYQNALFNAKLDRNQDLSQSLATSYDLILLSQNIEKAKSSIEQYLAFTPLADYVISQPAIEIKYNTSTPNPQYLLVLGGVLIVLIVVLILVVGLVIKSRRTKITFSARHSKLRMVLGNLDKALSKKKISDSEYFFMRKKYEAEISHTPNVKDDRKNLNLSIDDLRAKLRALEKGMHDLRRHYKEGLLLSEDYIKNYRQVSGEINEVKEEIKIAHSEVVANKKASALKRRREAAPIKGTEELAYDEEEEERKEKIKRKKTLRRFAYK